MGNITFKAQKCQDVEISKRLAKKRQKQWEELIMETEVSFDEVFTGNQERFRKDINKIFVYEVGNKKHCNKNIYDSVRQTISKLTKKELLSTICYLKWEQAFLQSLKDESNPNFLLEIESKRISNILFSDYKDNFFVRLIRKFDASVAIQYESEIRQFLCLTCSKFSNMSYKVNFNLYREYRPLRCLLL